NSEPAWLHSWLLQRAAKLLDSAGQWQQADGLYRRSAEIASNCAPPLLVEILKTLGSTYDERNDFIKAEEYYQQSLSILRKSGAENFSVAKLLMKIGEDQALRLVDLRLAKSYYLQCLDIQQKLVPDGLDSLETLAGLAMVANESGDLSGATEYLRQAQALKDLYGLDGHWSLALLKIQASLAYNAGDFSTSERYYRQILDIANLKSPGTLFTAFIMDDLGDIAWYRSDFAG